MGFNYYRAHSDYAFDDGPAMRGFAYYAFSGHTKGHTRRNGTRIRGVKYWYLHILLFNYVHTFSYHKPITTL